MSVLRVTRMQTQGGSAKWRVSYGTAKAWADYNQQIGPTINESANVSSISDEAAGNFTANFTNEFTDRFISMLWSVEGVSTFIYCLQYRSSSEPTTGTLPLYCMSTNAGSTTAIDRPDTFSVYGRLA